MKGHLWNASKDGDCERVNRRVMSLGRVSECIYKTPPDKSAAISGGLTERQSQTARLRHRERRSSRLKQIFFEVPIS
jgi:hypothetical protein